VVQEELDEALMVGDAAGDNWLVLRGTATEIWRLLEHPIGLDQIERTLADRYSGGDRIREDVEDLLRRLDEKNLIEARDDG
jgi:Coenzyme PQQ synthesis protein D (PqqD)